MNYFHEDILARAIHEPYTEGSALNLLISRVRTRILLSLPSKNKALASLRHAAYDMVHIGYQILRNKLNKFICLIV